MSEESSGTVDRFYRNVTIVSRETIAVEYFIVAGKHMGKPDITKVFAVVNRRIQMSYVRELPAAGVKYGLMRYIMCIHNNPGITQEQMAAMMAVEKSSVAKAVKQMLAEGYVTRRVNENCRRENILLPTDKARAAHDKIIPIKKKVHAEVTRNMSGSERGLFLRLLEKLALD